MTISNDEQARFDELRAANAHLRKEVADLTARLARTLARNVRLQAQLYEAEVTRRGQILTIGPRELEIRCSEGGDYAGDPAASRLPRPTEAS
jgi:hypothetical protein